MRKPPVTGTELLESIEASLTRTRLSEEAGDLKAIQEATSALQAKADETFEDAQKLKGMWDREFHANGEDEMRRHRPVYDMVNGLLDDLAKARNRAYKLATKMKRHK